jgi:hypothetical protein
MIRRLAGAVASLLAMLGGLWLILVPFALGIQPQDTNWTHETLTNVWSGIGLGVLGLIGLVTFTTALLQHLAARGMITPRKARISSAQPAPAEAMPAPEADPPPAASTDLDNVIASLVAALRTDLDRDRDAEQATSSGHAREPAEPALATNNSDHNNSDHQPTSVGNN